MEKRPAHLLRCTEPGCSALAVVQAVASGPCGLRAGPAGCERHLLPPGGWSLAGWRLLFPPRPVMVSLPRIPGWLQ